MEKNLQRENVEKEFIEFCEKNRIKINSQKLENLYRYYELLNEWNEKINLTAITKLEDVYVKHFEDSLLGVALIKDNSSLCDIGTGAGFPGLVLAIIKEDIKVTLVDALQKRVKFLNLIVSELNLPNVTVLHNRAEDVDFKNSYLNSFDYVVARAVARLNVLTEYCLPYVKVGGQFIAYKSEKTEEEILECKNAFNVLGGELKEVINLQLKDMVRNLVVIIKNKSTNISYPRGQNKPKLKPL